MGVREYMKQAARGTARGFSLMELMLVLAIIGVLMVVVTVNVAGGGARAKKRATEASLKTIKSSLDSYNLNYSTYPPDLRTLIVAKFLDDSNLKDGWDSDIFYVPSATGSSSSGTERPFQLGSAGEDRNLGNADDIDVWSIK